MGMQSSFERGRAASYLASVNAKIARGAAARRQGHLGKGAGERPAAGLGAAPVALVGLSRPRAEGRQEAITPPAYRTARRALPRTLSGLRETDPRLAAARFLADTFERVGAVKGADLEGQRAHSGGAPDGGATTRVKHAARLRLIEALANRWAIDPARGVLRGAPRALLKIQRRTARRQEIQAFPALLALCVDGAELPEILSRFGWPVKHRYRVPLRDALLAALDDVAAGLSLGRSADSAALDKNGPFRE